MNETTQNIREWAKERAIDKADPAKQMVKLLEELGELAKGIAKNNQEQIKDGLGDVYVVLTILAMQLGYKIEDCAEIAYREIKDRKGKTINGIFVKDSDLAEAPVINNHGYFCPHCGWQLDEWFKDELCKHCERIINWEELEECKEQE